MDDEDVPESRDGLFGYTVRRLREKAGLSQAALAAAMQERDWPWHQSTIYRVESGRQTVSFWEARDLAAIFGVPLERFSWKTGEANAIDWLDMAAHRLASSFAATKLAVTAQLSAVTLAERALEDTAKYTAPRVVEAREDLMHAIEEYGPVEFAVEDGIRAYEGRHEDGEDDKSDGEAPAAESPGTAQRSA
jgi:transcriptional regulator with XRE-family HTH domain